MKVYMDNGATTRPDKEVIEAMQPIFEEDYGNSSSLHGFGEKAKSYLVEAREIVAKTLNAQSDEIVFTSGGTESDNLAIKGYAYANKDKGNHIITSTVEHPAILKTCKYLEKKGFEVTYLEVDQEGFVSVDDLKDAITDKTILVSIMHGNNEIGTIMPIKEIGDVCKEKEVTFHTDAVQSYTKVPLDVKEINVDMISVSSHKIHGPKGVGALYVRKGTRLEPLAHGGSHEFNKRAGTENVAGIYGFAKAAELNNLTDCDRIEQLRNRLIEGLLSISDSKLNGPKENRLCNNVSVGYSYVEGEAILTLLDLAGIGISTGSACSSKSLEPSHVLLAIGLARKESHGTIRYTISKYTTEEEVDYVIEQSKKAMERLRMMSPLNADTIDQYDDVDEEDHHHHDCGDCSECKH